MENIIYTLKNSCIKISKLIRDSSSAELDSLSYIYNFSGDDVKQLDVMANKILKKDLLELPEIRTIGSEEEDKLIYKNNDGLFMVCFDPLDGSSNIGVNITTGTIFAIYKYDNGMIQNGRNIVSAGYCLYGGSTQFILATKNIVKIYQLINNHFNLISDKINIRGIGSIYSINESNKNIWLDKRYQKLVNDLINKNYTTRWIASLVADAHRTLIKGGIFCYPGNINHPDGKIRLLYEAYPMAYIFEQANGYSSNGKISLLDVNFPDNVHQKTPIILSSKFEFDIFNSL